MTAALVPVEALTRMSDRFRCDPLRADMSARSCIARQANARDGAKFSPIPAALGFIALRLKPVACRDCAIGRDVAARVRSAAIARAATPAEECPKCGATTVPSAPAKHPEWTAFCAKCRNVAASYVYRFGYTRDNVAVALLTQTGAEQRRRGRELAVLGVATRDNNAAGGGAS